MATILAVDDEPIICRLLVEVLENEGHRVLAADTPFEALAMFRKCRGQVDLLVSDIVMPGMDGRALAAKCREERPDLPVLLISGGYRGSLGSGVSFLAKPFDIAELANRVRVLLPKAPASTPVLHTTEPALLRPRP